MRIVVLTGPEELGESAASAVGQALRVARARIDVSVSVLTAGPRSAASVIRDALVLGADDGVHVLDDVTSNIAADPLVLSRVLAAALDRMGYDLVLCGAGAASAGPGRVVLPVMLAERLGVPALLCADTVRVESCDTSDANEVTVTSDGGEFVEELSVRLPAVASVTERFAPTHYPPFLARTEARHKLVREWRLEQFGDGIGTGRSQVTTVVRAAPAPTRAATIIDAHGDPKAAAVRLAEFLEERRFV